MICTGQIGSVAMLSHVAHFVSGSSILLVGAYRDAEVDRRHPLADAIAAMSRQRNFDKLTLGGLEESDLANLLGMIGDENAPDAVVKALGAATEGNPLLIRELLLHLVEEKKIGQGGHGWISRLSVEELGIPEGVRQVVSRRLQKLSAEANRLLSVASAFNGEFSFDIAASVAELDEVSARSGRSTKRSMLSCCGPVPFRTASTLATRLFATRPIPD